MKDISGAWTFKEDFGNGTDKGVATLCQTGTKISGMIEYTETIEGMKPFEVKQKVRGSFDGTYIELYGVSVEIISEFDELDYNLDSWIGMIEEGNQIAGQSYDEEACMGLFIMDKQ